MRYWMLTVPFLYRMTVLEIPVPDDGIPSYVVRERNLERELTKASLGHVDKPGAGVDRRLER